MYEIGRLCIKLAGRDARKKCVIVDILNENYVLIDGQTRRRKCNIKHLEPLNKIIQIKKNASHSDVVEALKKEGIKVEEKKVKNEKKEKLKKLKEVEEKRKETIKERAVKKKSKQEKKT